MRSVPIRELKAQLAKYLRMAQRGVEVHVLDRGVAIARLLPMPEQAPSSHEAGLERLVCAGIVRRGQGSVRALVARRLSAAANLRETVEEDREDRA